MAVVLPLLQGATFRNGSQEANMSQLRTMALEREIAGKN